NHAGADGIPRAAIDDETIAQRQDAAVVVKADLDIVELVARVAGAHQVLAAVLDPPDPAPPPARPKPNQQSFPIDMPPYGEARPHHPPQPPDAAAPEPPDPNRPRR